jgi:glutathione S-transferase
MALTPGPYILGERFSAVDVYLGSQMGFGMMMKSFEPRPIFQNYVALLSQRPAYKRFTEQGDQLVARVKTQATVA